MSAPTSIFEILTWAGDTLKPANATRLVKQNPRLDAQVLLSYILNVNSAYLFTHGDEILSNESLETFQRLIARRARHEPVAYLTQTKAFYGRDFFVNNHVLIPRPDTETLIEAALAVINSRRANGDVSTIIDIGTGSGAIAITLALETHQPTVAIDIDPNVLHVAQHNAETLGASITFLEGSLFEPFEKGSGRLLYGFEIENRTITDLTPSHLVITANLPYLTPWQWNDLDADVKNYEPKLALVGGADGLALYDELCVQLRSYLHEQSRRGTRIAVDLFIEIDPSQRLTAPALLKAHFPDSKILLINDMSHRERIVHCAIR